MSRRSGLGHGVRVSRSSNRNTGSAIANRSAVAVKGGSPPAMTLLATTVLPTVTIASAHSAMPFDRSDMPDLSLSRKGPASRPARAAY